MKRFRLGGAFSELRLLFGEWLLGKALDVMPRGPERGLMAYYAWAYSRNILEVNMGSPGRWHVNQDQVESLCSQIVKRRAEKRP